MNCQKEIKLRAIKWNSSILNVLLELLAIFIRNRQISEWFNSNNWPIWFSIFMWIACKHHHFGGNVRLHLEPNEIPLQKRWYFQKKASKSLVLTFLSQLFVVCFSIDISTQLHLKRTIDVNLCESQSIIFARRQMANK